MTNLEKHRADLKRLLGMSDRMNMDLLFEVGPKTNILDEADKKLKTEVAGKFSENYQSWFTESCALLQQVLPQRHSEFVSYYLPDPKRKEVSMITYSIQDWLLGRRSLVDWRTKEKTFNDLHVVLLKFSTQCEILKSAEKRFESSLFDIRHMLRADLFDSELDAANELLKHGFLRGAGAISGVVLEKHLHTVCDSHAITIKKSHPTISTLNDALKEASVIDVPTWRFIQRLGDLRNLCDHGKEREPIHSEIDELIAGVRKISKTVY